MPRATAIQRLSNELLRDILDCIEADPDRSVSIDRRAYLSVESFRLPSPPLPSQAQDIASFRLSCRRFAELGIPHQFTRVATRFSKPGFQRLERICSQAHLARHTKKFSYLIPYFYTEGRTRVRDLLHHASDDLAGLDVSHFESKIETQRSIVRSGEDGRVLRKAMVAFRSLQHVQILRLQDEPDRRLLEYLHDAGDDDDGPRLVDLRWSPACTHATKTVAEALSYAGSPFSRFSGPMMNPQSALYLKGRVPTSVTSLAERLTCLELHFDDGSHLDERMADLGGLFRAVFRAARNMQAVHLGFPSRLPLDLPLEDIFHGVHWEKLRAFGIQAWRLHADEIVALARRHRRTLRGLRLRDVQLRPGSTWKEVLAVLRGDMEQLEWVSLRRIDYAAHFDSIWAGVMEVPDWPPGLASDSEESEDNDAGDDGADDAYPFAENGAFEHGSDDDADSDDASIADTDHGPDANELELMPDTPASLPFCTCESGASPITAEDLGDNGRFVVYQQRKMWERWVIGRCPEHAPPP